MLERAARAAVGCWFSAERRLCEGVQSADAPDRVFPDDWFRYWGVGRTFRRDGNRDAIRGLLFDKRSELMAAGPDEAAWQLVQQLASEIQPMNAGWRPTSLVSKYAYSCAPRAFSPYDRFARGQLQTRDHDYVGYSQAFTQRKFDIRNQLAAFVRPDGGVGLSAQNLPVDGRAMNEDIFVARTTDWFLLLQGGFDDTKWPAWRGPMIAG